MTNNGAKVEEIIKEEYETPISPYDGKYTKTTQFMLPAIGINVRNRLIFSYFVNSYLDDKGHRHEYERPIFVLFAVKDFAEKNWRKVYEALVKSANYANDYDCGIQNGKNLVMMVFKIPEEFAEDYYRFKLGRYSLFSDKYKEKFPKFITDEAGNEGKESIIWQVINKAPGLKREVEKEFNMKEGELDLPTDGKVAEEIWDIPRKKREYFRYEETVSG